MVEFSYKGRHKKHPNALDTQHALPTTTPPSLHRKVCFSFAAYACTVISHLHKCNVPISRGLSDEEFQQIQARFGFDFPPDLRSILQEGLPVGAGFPNWRSSPPKQLLNMITLPAKGLCNEVLRGTFWCKQWGKRPDRLEDAVRIAKLAFKTAPVLVPIYSHCYIPCFPNLSGNPIFFIFQKDLFYCGYDLADFFGREVFVPLQSLFESSGTLGYSDESASKSMQPHGNGCGKQKNMGIIEGEMMMESKLRAAAYTKNDGPLYHGDTRGGHQQSKGIHDVYYHSQNLLTQHHRHSHRRSDKEVKWDALNKRLLAELQNAEAKDETLSRKSLCEEHLHGIDRPPKSLIRSAGNSPRMGQGVMSRYAYFHAKPLPAKVLAQFTIAAPPWAAKMARHVPMWSDLIQNKDSMCSVNVQCGQDVLIISPEHVHNSTMMKQGIEGNSQERAFDVINHGLQSRSVHVSQSNGSSYVWNVVQREGCSSCDGVVVQSKKSDSDLHNAPRQQEFKLSGRNPKCAPANQEKQGSREPNRRWLVPYFKDMERTLKRGGWKHGEIEEMITALLPDDESFSLVETRQGIHDVLNRSANAMFLFLQKAGWNVHDVEEILSL